MSRSDPFKKKRRAAKTTVLIYGEGQAEEIFLKHLRYLYAHNSGVAITIKKGKGGTPDEIVTSATKDLGGFDKKFVVVDNDKTKEEIEEARKKAKKNNIYIIENTPCLEALMLDILEENKSFKTKSSSWCKQEFEKKYINRKQRAEIYKYQQLFTKPILDKQRKILKALDLLISIMEGKC